MKKVLFVLISSTFLISCSPLYILAVQNNSEKPIELYVELKNEKYTQDSKRTFEKREVFNYKGIENADKFSIDSLGLYLKTNRISSKKYNFTSKFNYNFRLDSQLITTIDPSNSISIYPFEKIYYVQDDKKCFIVPKIDNQECNFKTTHKQKLKKDKKIDFYSDFIIIEN